MYTRMLIPLDGSKLAENVLPYARAMARALDGPIELLSVVDSMDSARTSHAGHVRSVDAIVEAAVQESRRYLEGIARSFTGRPVTCVVEQGQPEEVIIERAAGDKETLIGMATRGRSGIHRWLMGSVAEKVLRGASTPLLLVRGDAEGKNTGEATLKSIVVPLDGSKLAETVLPHAVELAKKLESRNRSHTRLSDSIVGDLRRSRKSLHPEQRCTHEPGQRRSRHLPGDEGKRAASKRRREGFLHLDGRLGSRRDHRPGAWHTGQFDRHVHPRTLRGKALGAGKRNRKGRASLGGSGFGCPGRVRPVSSDECRGTRDFPLDTRPSTLVLFRDFRC